MNHNRRTCLPVKDNPTEELQVVVFRNLLKSVTLKQIDLFFLSTILMFVL